MRFRRFEDIVAWQKAQDLAVEIYDNFGNSKDYGFKDQITRASVSISNNIAEGFERGSDAEFLRFLRYSRTSSNEVKSMVYLAERLRYIDLEKKEFLILMIDEIGRIIYGLMKSLG